MNRIIGIVLFLASAATTATPASPSPVTYEIPASWKLMRDDRPDVDVHTLTYEVAEDSEPSDHPVVMIKTYKSTPDLQLDTIDMAEVAAHVVPSGVPVSEADDGSHWRTAVFLGHPGDAKIIALYRIGIQDGYVVEVAFIFPLATGTSEELALLSVYGQADQQGRTTGVYAPLQNTYKTISIFNAFARTLAINGHAPFDAKAVMARPAGKPTAAYRWVNSPASAASTGH